MDYKVIRSSAGNVSRAIDNRVLLLGTVPPSTKQITFNGGFKDGLGWSLGNVITLDLTTTDSKISYVGILLQGAWPNDVYASCSFTLTVSDSSIKWLGELRFKYKSYIGSGYVLQIKKEITLPDASTNSAFTIISSSGGSSSYYNTVTEITGL